MVVKDELLFEREDSRSVIGVDPAEALLTSRLPDIALEGK
jgi:hypothetical protein